MARIVEPDNPKTVALQAEILSSEKKWPEAIALLEPLREKAQEPYVKIMYAECLAHLSGLTAAYEWLRKYGGQQEDDEIKLNIATFASWAGEDDYALQLFDELKKKASPGPYPYLYAASIYIKKATPRGLITISRSVDIELRINKQLLHAALDNLSKGIELLRKAGRSPEEIAQAVINLSKVHLALGDASLAHKTLRREWKIARAGSEAWFTAATIAVTRDRRLRALVMGRHALQLAGEDELDSLVRFAVICMQAGEWDEALDVTEKVLQRASADDYRKAALQMKAYCQLEQGLSDPLAETVSELKTKFPKDESWMLTQTISLLKLRGPREALEFLEKEKTDLPPSIPISLQLAGLLYQNKLYEKALLLYKEIAFQTQNPSVFDMTVMVALEANRPEDALFILDEAENAGMVSERFIHYRAVALALSKEFEPAIELFASLPQNSLTGNDLLLYADSCEQRADPERAIAILQKGLERYPSDVRLRRKLFFLYRETNRLEKALEQAVQWLEIDPDDRAPYFAVMMTGFPLGAEAAGKALSDYFTRFGEGPELQSGTVEDIKKFVGQRRTTEEMLWKQYQDGQAPEAALGNRSKYGIGGTRLLLLLHSNQRVMAFNGDAKNQEKEFTNLLETNEVVLDYHALITIFLLKLLDPRFQITSVVILPEIVLRDLREDLIMLPSFYQEGRHGVLKNVLSRIQKSFKIHEIFPKPSPSIRPENFKNSLFDLLVCKEEHCVYVTPGFEITEDAADSNEYGVDIITVLDLIDLLKETGIIPVTRYETVLSDMSKHKIKRLKKLEKAPERIMVDWYTLEMLETHGLLADMPKLSKDVHVGPFSYAIVRSEVEEWQRMAEIIETLRDIESLVGSAVQDGRIKVAPSSEKLDSISTLSKEMQLIKYLRELKETCAGQNATLWTDDLFTKTVLSTEGVKAVGTRTVLDYLGNRGVLTRQEVVEKVTQL
jgi:tetratricopeptide (TPR) repeat protein